MPSKKRATPVSLQPLDALFGTNEESINGISEIAIGSLHPFPNHPFQVRDAQCNSGALSVLVCIDSADFWNPIYVVSDKD